MPIVHRRGMTSPYVARTMVAMMLLAALSGVVLADDAGSGGDAGSSTSTAVYLPASNATYYGNLSSTDGTDYFGINMSTATGIAAQLTSPSGADFDLILRTSTGVAIDTSYSTSLDDVTSNGTNVGGSTVFIEVDWYSGSGQYTLQIWIFSTAGQPGSNQDDAGSGTDAGADSTGAVAASAANTTYMGWISDNWDSTDWYSVSVPANHYIYADMVDFANASYYGSHIRLLDSSGNSISYDYGDTWSTISSNGSSVAGTTVYIQIASSSDEGYYNFSYGFGSTSSQPGSNQDDAGTGGDAGNTASAATNLSVPVTGGNYTGWVSQNWDREDWYRIPVPVNHTIWASVAWDNSSADLDIYMYDSTGLNTVDYSASSFDNPEQVTANGTTVGGGDVLFRVRAYSGDSNYTMSFGMENVTGVPTSDSQNDANTGDDAGDNTSYPTDLPNSNGSYWGYISNTDDDDDYYRINVTCECMLDASLAWNNSDDYDLILLDSSGGFIDYSYFSNPEEVSSGATNITNQTVFVRVNAWTGEGEYNLNITITDLSSHPMNNQNDSGSGDDAGDDVDSMTNVTVGIGMTNFTGWGSSDVDQNDYYLYSVPIDYGIAIEMNSEPTVIRPYLVLGWASNYSTIDSSTNLNGYEMVTSNGSIVSGEDVVLRVVAWEGEGEYNLTVWIFTLDTDGDGYWDTVEVDCGSDPDDASDYPVDTDADGRCDALDNDDDNDGVVDNDDDFPLDPNEQTDTDNDGVGDNADDDDDGDGWTDADENTCGSDPLDDADRPLDTDGDLVCDVVDEDDDGDGVLDDDDAFPKDATESVDTDGDGIGDNADTDDDGDGYSDSQETTCLSDPMDRLSIPLDTDGDGQCDEEDFDDDGDGRSDAVDAFPLDASEWADFDGDGVGDNADVDDDGDGRLDNNDAFPYDVTEWDDFDNDGIGDNADEDDDGDTWSDVDESNCGTDPYSSLSIPDDFDLDHICDLEDSDDDNDGIEDVNDWFPFDAAEWDDTDRDGIGDHADTDDDGDGWMDVDEPNCGSDPLDANSVPLDNDGDMVCDIVDIDDDNDGVQDVDDAFPMDGNEWMDTDGDGQGNNADIDDDGDSWTDNQEEKCGTASLAANSVPLDTDGDGICDSIDPDDDGDGVVDVDDEYPLDGSEWEDRNGDGLGDNAHPLSILDHMKLNPGLTALIIILLLGAIGASAAVVLMRKKDEEEAVYSDDEYSNYDSAENWQELEQYVDEDVADDLVAETPAPPPGFGQSEELATEPEEPVTPTAPPVPPGFDEPETSEFAPPPPPGFDEPESSDDAPPPPPGFAPQTEEPSTPPPPPGFGVEDEDTGSDIPPPPPGF